MSIPWKSLFHHPARGPGRSVRSRRAVGHSGHARSPRSGCGVGAVQAAEQWALSRGCLKLKVETQTINVPACRFYAWHGCVLKAVRPDAYPALPQEIQLLWERFRRVVVAPIETEASFLDIGCANGPLMESVVEWAHEDGSSDFTRGVLRQRAVTSGRDGS
jgi:hypothetical protein